MKLLVIVGTLAAAVVAGAAGLLVFANETSQLRTSDLPTPDISPTSQPSPVPTREMLEMIAPQLPPRPVQVPTPAQTPFSYLINLNTDLNLYDRLGLTPEQSAAIIQLRCAPPGPFEAPYPVQLDGCPPGVAGISYLDDIVEAGIMTEQEVHEILSGKVAHPWRAR